MQLAAAEERCLLYRRVNVRKFLTLDLCEMMLTKRLVVLGIMLTFPTMGTSGGLAATSIMIGLSFALKATAAGLLVAVPCVVMNNILRRRVIELLAQYNAQHGS
jgi:biopolymer transport protein ExbB